MNVTIGQKILMHKNGRVEIDGSAPALLAAATEGVRHVANEMQIKK